MTKLTVKEFNRRIERGKVIGEDELVELVNNLHEENQELKSENNMLRNTIGRNEAYIDRLTHQSEWCNNSKVKLNDIIGIVKTEEVTNSVELKKELYK